MKYLSLLFLLFSSTLFCQKDDIINLNEVNIQNKTKYILLKSYFRSWIVKNDSLTDFVDGEAYYLYPKEEFKDKLKVKRYVLQYRNFYNPEIKGNNKKTQVSIMNDYYGFWNIPSCNRHEKYKKVEISKDNFDIYNSRDSIIGKYYQGIENDSINFVLNFSRKKNIKISLSNLGKWDKKGIPQSFTLIQNEDLFGSKKEIVTEIFITKELLSDFDNGRKKYNSINFNTSNYYNNYWGNYLIGYPLPLEIVNKLDLLIEQNP